MGSLAPSKSTFRFGIFEAHPAKGTLLRKGVRIKLQDQPFRVLCLLLERPNEIVTREELRLALWPADTYVDFDGSLNAALKRLRSTLGDNADNPTFIETVPKRGYRFVAPVAVETSPELAPAEPPDALVPQHKPQTQPTATEAPTQPRLSARWGMTAAAILLLAIGGYRLFFVRKVQALKITDTIVMADFTNETGDPVFDDALKQALSLQLSQSPFLNLVAEGRVRSTMRQMGLSTSDFISAETARGVCQRTNSAAVISGSIRTQGSQYVLDLKALSCGTGESLAEEEAAATKKDDVLPALDRASNGLRTKVGEPLLSVAKYDIPVYQATTRSLEALKAYSLGAKIELSKGATAAIPFYQHALELDPDFALAYSNLGVSYHNSGEVGRAVEYFTKAFERRDRVTERERFAIESFYYSEVTGELEKANTIYDVWTQTYPRDSLPHHNWSANLASMGQYEKAAAEAREALRLAPAGTINTNYGALEQWYTALDRLEEAKATYKEAAERNVNDPLLHWNRYGIAFLENDTAEMKRQVQWASGKAGVEDVLLLFQSDTESSQGHLRKADNDLLQAIDSDRRNNLKETVALLQICAALRAAEFGFPVNARKQVQKALSIARSRDIEVLAALALARSGDYPEALRMAAKLGNQFPLDTLMQAYWLPVIRASVELGRHNPEKATAMLEVTKPYELGSSDTWFEEGSPFYPVYLRGQSYLLLHQGSQAADEFRKYFEHRGAVQNCYLGAFARVELARAYAAQGDTKKAAAAYQEFLTLWNEADPEIPILRQAKQESAKLHRYTPSP
jgi:eukaryotic-like serine/threonine-protein kinase